jgi:biotin carboxylase
MARVLGLPGVDPAIAYITNNKNVFRRRLKELGYPVPEFREIAINTIDETDDAVCEIGYPLIVKNTDSSGSRGTRIFYQEDSQGVRKAVRQAITVSRSGYALIEEFWVGREQTVETLFDWEGKFHPCFITDRHFDMSEGFAIETGLRHPTTLPPEVQKEMYDLVEHVARDLGITIGAAKADMILTREGPRIIEMAVRLSGGFDCQFLVPAATGKNVLRAAVLTAMGEPFPDDLLKDTKHRVGLTASLWPGPGRIAAIEGVEEAKKIPGFEHVFFRYQAGDQVEPYIDCTKRVCFIIASGKDEPSARKAMDQVLKTIRIRIDRGIPDA